MHKRGHICLSDASYLSVLTPELCASLEECARAI